MAQPLLNQSKFNINLVSANRNVSYTDKATYAIAEKYVKKHLTDAKGTETEIAKHNEVLQRCVLGDKNAQVQIKFLIRQILEQSNITINTDDIEYLVDEIYRNNYGLGAIDDLIADDSINEIWVNGYDQIWIEKGGIKTRLNRRFKSDEEVVRVMRQMLQFDKKDINPLNPTIESKLIDGSRITFAIPPVALRPTINIRKFRAFELTEHNLLLHETITKEMLEFMKIIIKGRANLLIIGETGSGKTSFLKFLCDYISPKLRLGTIESNFELKLSEKYPDRNIFEYEAHEELGRTLGFLFKLCLRSSPDIIILGEARGAEEAEQLINAMRRGHPGSIGTIHTNSAETAIDDIVEMILEDGKKREPSLLKHRVANAIEFIIQAHRFEDTGERKITRITEVVSIEDENSYGKYELNDIFVYDVKNRQFRQTGKVKNPRLLKKMQFFGLTDEELAKIKWEGD